MKKLVEFAQLAFSLLIYKNRGNSRVAAQSELTDDDVVIETFDVIPNAC